MTDSTTPATTDVDSVLAEIRALHAAPPPPVLEGPVESDYVTTVDGFEDLDAFFDDHLELPIRGKIYRIPPANAELGLLCTKLISAGEQVANTGKINDDTATELNDEEETDIYRRLLGPVMDELVADGIDWQRIQHVGSTAMIWTALGKIAAVNFWKSGARPKAPASPTRAVPQDHKPKGSGKSDRPGSRDGTTPRKKAAKAVAGGDGRTSSDSGA